MSEKFQNKYRIQSARLHNWDYGSNAAYFVTICTAHHECYFGEIIKMQMQLTEIGIIAQQCWIEIPNHFRYVELAEFVVMPNHVHGIIIIDKPGCGNGSDGGDRDRRDAINRVSTIMKQEPEPQIKPEWKSVSETERKMQTGGFAGNKNPMLNDNLSRIIRWYKGRVSFESRKIHADFTWQSRFYDHIIRNDESFQRISDYIINNPSNWMDDKFYTKL